MSLFLGQVALLSRERREQGIGAPAVFGHEDPTIMTNKIGHEAATLWPGHDPEWRDRLLNLGE